MTQAQETQAQETQAQETQAQENKARGNDDVVTQITSIKLPPDHQDEVLTLMTERAQFMAKQPGFVSICLYRSEDGSHVINHIQWIDREKLKAAHHSPEFRKEWRHFGDMAKEIEPCLYDLVHVETASSARATARA